jgi:hypothetical protein
MAKKGKGRTMKRRPATKRKSKRKPTRVGTFNPDRFNPDRFKPASFDPTPYQTAASRRKLSAAVQSTTGETEPPPPTAGPTIEPPTASTEISSTSPEVRVVVPPPGLITPTIYPDSPDGKIIVHNYITINAESVNYKNFNITADALVKQLQVGGSNQISGEVCAQLLSEITAGRELLKGPKPSRDLVNHLLVAPLKFLAKVAAGAVIGTLAGEALKWLMKMLL